MFNGIRVGKTSINLDEFDHDLTSWRHWNDGICKEHDPQMSVW
jgi:hypothetical protein